MTKDPKKALAAFTRLFDKAIKHVDGCVPLSDKATTPGLGNVRQVATAILVAAKAVALSLAEMEGEFDD